MKPWKITVVCFAVISAIALSIYFGIKYSGGDSKCSKNWKSECNSVWDDGRVSKVSSCNDKKCSITNPNWESGDLEANLTSIWDNFSDFYDGLTSDSLCTTWARYLYWCLQDQDYTLRWGLFYFFSVQQCSLYPSCFGNNYASPYGLSVVPWWGYSPAVNDPSISAADQQFQLVVGSLGAQIIDSRSALVLYGKTPPECLYWSFVPYLGTVKKYRGKITVQSGAEAAGAVVNSMGDAFNIFDFIRELTKADQLSNICKENFTQANSSEAPPSSSQSPECIEGGAKQPLCGDQLCHEDRTDACEDDTWPCPAERYYVMIVGPNQTLNETLATTFKGKVNAGVPVLTMPMPAGTKWKDALGILNMDNKYCGDNLYSKYPDVPVAPDDYLYNPDTDDSLLLFRGPVRPTGNSKQIDLDSYTFPGHTPMGLMGVETTAPGILYNTPTLYRKPRLPLVKNSILQGTERTPELLKAFSDEVDYLIGLMEKRGFCESKELGVYPLTGHAMPDELLENWDGTGWDASLLVNNFNADNPDAIYFTSDNCCMGNRDVAICFGINHAGIGTSVYNNYNVYSATRSNACADNINDTDIYKDARFTIGAYSKSDYTCNDALIPELNGLVKKINLNLSFPQSGKSTTDTSTITFSERIYCNQAVWTQQGDLPESPEEVQMYDGTSGNIVSMSDRELCNPEWLNVTGPDPTTLIKQRVIIFTPNSNVYSKWCSSSSDTTCSSSSENSVVCKKNKKDATCESQYPPESTLGDKLSAYICGDIRGNLNTLKQRNKILIGIDGTLLVVSFVVIITTIIFFVVAKSKGLKVSRKVWLVLGLSSGLGFLLTVAFMIVLIVKAKELGDMTAAEANTVMGPYYGSEKFTIIDSNRGQWDDPGKITRINSNRITMGPDPKTGEPQKYELKVVGEQTGEIQYGYPGGPDLVFLGDTSVIEIPQI